MTRLHTCTRTPHSVFLFFSFARTSFFISYFICLAPFHSQQLRLIRYAHPLCLYCRSWTKPRNTPAIMGYVYPPQSLPISRLGGVPILDHELQSRHQMWADHLLLPPGLNIPDVRLPADEPNTVHSSRALRVSTETKCIAYSAAAGPGSCLPTHPDSC